MSVKSEGIGGAIRLSIKIDATAAEVGKLIDSIQRRGKLLDVDLHSAACASLNHVALHNDPTLLNRLITAMPKASRRNAVVAWALKHGNVALNDVAKTKEAMPLVYSKEAKADITAAQAEPFWALKNVREGGDAWVYADYIKSVTSKLQKAADADPTGAEGNKARKALAALKEAV